MKTFNMVKNHFEDFRNYIRPRLSTPFFFLYKTMNPAPVCVSYIFGKQYNMGVSISSSLDFCVCKYFDVE